MVIVTSDDVAFDNSVNTEHHKSQTPQVSSKEERENYVPKCIQQIQVKVLLFFFAIWVLLGLFSTGFFFINRNAGLKRKVWPWFVIGTGVLFLGFSGFSGGYQILYFAGPAVALITIMNLHLVKFCDSCGKTIYTAFLLSPKFCSQCGAKLK